MRFSILKKWSHIIHRRGRSDSHIHFLQPTAPPDGLSHSVSAGNVDNDNLDERSHIPLVSPDCVSSQAKSSSRFSAGSSASAPEPANTQSKSPSNDSTSSGVVQKLVTAKRRLSQLDEEKESLKSCLKDAKASSSVQQERLENLKQDLQTARTSCLAEKKRLRDIKSQAQRDVQRKRFAEALLELGNTQAGDVGSFLDASEEEIVDSIRKAAEQEGSVWCTVLSDIVGPLAPDNYVSAINIALGTRKELRSVRKVARFWRRTANKTQTITPSASNLSEVREPLSAERRRAVQKLQRQRLGRSVDFSTSTRSLVPSASASSETSAYLPYLSSTHTISSRRHESLGPLASQVFRAEMRSAHGGSARFAGSSSQLARLRTSDSTDQNQPKQKPPSQKALGKQKEGTQTKLQVLLSDTSAHNDSRALVPPALPNLELPSPISGVLWSESKTQEPENTFIQAERALHSFERICNSFPSSNFGSLHAINEEHQDGYDITLVNTSRSESNPLSIHSMILAEVDTTMVESESNEKDKLGSEKSPSKSILCARRASYCSPDRVVPSTTKRPRPTSVSFVLPRKEDAAPTKSVAPLKIVKKNKRSSLILF